MNSNPFSDNFSNLHPGGQGAERILEYYLHFLPERFKFASIECHYVRAVEEDFAVGFADESQDALAGRSFSAA